MSGTRAISTTSRRELSSHFFSSCKARHRRKFTPFWQKHWLVSFLVGLRTYQHPCIKMYLFVTLSYHSSFSFFLLATQHCAARNSNNEVNDRYLRELIWLGERNLCIDYHRLAVNWCSLFKNTQFLSRIRCDIRHHSDQPAKESTVL